MADTTQRKIKLVYDTIRAVSNISENQIVLREKIQMLIDNEFASNGDDPLTDEILAAETALAYLTYDKFAQAKTVSDALISLWEADNRAIEKMINQLKSLIGQ